MMPAAPERGQSKLWWFLAVVAFALAIRLGAAVVLRDLSAGPEHEPVGADGIEFDALGWAMAQGEGYFFHGKLTSFRAPGFPLFLAAIYAVAGHNYFVAHLAFCMLGAITCGVTYLLALELLESRAALVAGVLGSVYFPHVYLSTLYFSESLFALALALALWLFLVGLRRGRFWLLAAAGLALGYAALTRPVALLAAPLLFLILVWAEVGARRWNFARPVVFTLGVLAAVFPWTIRNYNVHKQLVLIATNGGSTFYGANNDIVLHDRHEWGYWVTTLKLPGRDLVDAAVGEVAHDKVEWTLGKQWVRDHLSSMPWLITLKVLRLWLPDFHSPNKSYVWLSVAGYTPYLLLFVLGAWQCLRDRQKYFTLRWCALHGTVLATTVINTVIFYGCSRFLNAAAPLLMIYAALGLLALADRIVGLYKRPAIEAPASL